MFRTSEESVSSMSVTLLPFSTAKIAHQLKQRGGRSRRFARRRNPAAPRPFSLHCAALIEERGVNELRQALYLIAGEMRGMATIGRRFAGNVYETERAHRIMALAAEVAALAEGSPVDEVRAHFDAEPWQRFSPALGVDAA